MRLVEDILNKVCSIVKSKHEEYPILWVGQGVNMQDPDQVVGEVQGDSEQLAGNLHEESSQMAEEYTSQWVSQEGDKQDHGQEVGGGSNQEVGILHEGSSQTAEEYTSQWTGQEGGNRDPGQEVGEKFSKLAEECISQGVGQDNDTQDPGQMVGGDPGMEVGEVQGDYRRCTYDYMRTLRRVRWEIRMDWDNGDDDRSEGQKCSVSSPQELSDTQGLVSSSISKSSVIHSILRPVPENSVIHCPVSSTLKNVKKPTKIFLS